MLSMSKRNNTKINQLDRALPEGLLVDAAWLAKHGFSTSLRSQYVTAGKLEQPTRRVYRRPRGSISWQQVVISLQTLLEYPLVVGGRTALELQGFAHYLSTNTREVHLYGPKAPPTWLANLSVGPHFIYHNNRKFFRDEFFTRDFVRLRSVEKVGQGDPSRDGSANLTVHPWGQWDWQFVLSTPERALLELLDELPKHETFEQVNKLVANLPNLSPRRLEKLLHDCRNVKVKRLFFYFADRHKHAWLKHLHKESVDLGTGKRMLVKGGKLDPRYQITVPEDLNAV